MLKHRARVAIVLAVLVLLVAPSLLLARSQRRAATKASVLGTWFARITIPPNPLFQNTEDLVMLEFITFGPEGGLVATANFPVFKVPINGRLRKALVSVSHSAYRVRNSGLIQGTNWRFLNSTKNGSFLGFMKNIVEFDMVSSAELQGRFYLELLNPDLSPMELNGTPAILSSSVYAVRVPVETFP